MCSRSSGDQTIRAIENFWANLKRKVYSNNYPPKDVNCFMAKISKELMSIESTGLCKAMKEVPAKARKAHKMDVTFIYKKSVYSLVLK
jgi:hypothetical protein